VIDARHSRAVRLGAGAAGVSESETLARLERAHVALGLDANIPGAPETLDTLADTLARRPGRVTLVDMPDMVSHELVGRMRRVDPSVSVQTSRDVPADTTVSVFVGERFAGDAGAPAHVLAVPDNHGAHLSTDGAPVSQSRAPSSLGAMTTAALVAAEIFKLTAGVRPERMTLHRRLSFCPVTLGDDVALAPALAATSVEIALVGLGAVGTAIAQIVCKLPLRGRALLVDRQTLAPENLGTYSAAGVADVGRPKVDVVADLLGEFETTKFAGDIGDIPLLIDNEEVLWPQFLLAGLDSVDARHAAQRVWPEYLIDGATGDTVAGLHEVIGAGRPCLQCFLPPRVETSSSLVGLAAATGLTVEQLVNGDRPLLEDDLHALAPDQRARLQEHLAQALGLTSDDGSDTYQPSVPFVSQLAACLVVGRLVARLTDVDCERPNFAQFDTLIGPQSLHTEARRPREGCYCTENQMVIDAVRRRRASVSLS
jgi:hypothetical protein